MEPCGCEMARKAEREPDPQAAQTLREGAEAFRREWRCPGEGRREPEEDEAVAARLRPVERLTGASGMRTCPQWYASRPWAHRAAQARRWREHGELAAVDVPTSALVAAVETIDASVSARQQDDDERRERRRKQQ